MRSSSRSVTPKFAPDSVTVWPSLTVSDALVTTGASLTEVYVIATASVLEFAVPSFAVTLNAGEIGRASCRERTKLPASGAAVKDKIGVPGALESWKNPPGTPHTV